MDVRFWRIACEHFTRVLELSAEERAGYLNQLDVATRRGVESLMAAEDAADGFLEAPALSAGVTEGLKAAARKAPSLRLGPYLLERELSRSGMSRVFLARRDDGEYDKQVAVKIIAHETASEDLVARFRRERQILAALDHPHIARLLDGGSTEEGLPYLVMEYVEGTPIDEYCDREQLSVRERLELFLEVCAAVDYAHEKGVVHRDLKPANILVSEEGGPKLLDFGIAKLGERQGSWLEGDGTSPDARPMTPYYASPEQITGEAITRATDVYSLGVVLYKLLSGKLPYLFAEETAEAVKAAVLRQAPESLPERASRGSQRAADGTSGADGRAHAEMVSVARRTTPEALRRELSGDLDTIVRMALRKEPERRYGTVVELAEDLQRYLEGSPVTAQGDGRGYKARKYLQRNRARLVVAAVLVAALATTGGIWLRSRTLREDQQRLARVQEESQEVLSFIESLYEVPATMTRQGERVRADQLLEVGGQKSAKLLDSDPELAARLMRKIGEMYEDMGVGLRAERWLSSAESVEQSLARDAELENAGSEAGGWRAPLGLPAEVWRALRGSPAEGEGVLPAAEPSMTVAASGVCPGTLTFRVTGATPRSPAVLYGSVETDPARTARDPCRDAALALRSPRMLAVTLADSGGEAEVTRTLPRHVCYEKTYVVAVELATCTASTPVEVEASGFARMPLRQPRQRGRNPEGSRRPAESVRARP